MSQPNQNTSVTGWLQLVGLLIVVVIWIFGGPHAFMVSILAAALFFMALGFLDIGFGAEIDGGTALLLAVPVVFLVWIFLYVL